MNRDVCEHFNPVNLPCAKCAEKSKSETLFLIDELQLPLGTVYRSELDRRIITELRRLSSQRDELLTVLRNLLAEGEFTDYPNTTQWYAVQAARVVIAKAEGA